MFHTSVPKSSGFISILLVALMVIGMCAVRGVTFPYATYAFAEDTDTPSVGDGNPQDDLLAGPDGDGGEEGLPPSAGPPSETPENPGPPAIEPEPTTPPVNSVGDTGSVDAAGNGDVDDASQNDESNNEVGMAPTLGASVDYQESTPVVYTGRVEDASTGGGMAGVVVIVYADGTLAQQIRTDADSEWKTQALARGAQIRVTFEKEGFSFEPSALDGLRAEADEGYVTCRTVYGVANHLEVAEGSGQEPDVSLLQPDETPEPLVTVDENGPVNAADQAGVSGDNADPPETVTDGSDDLSDSLSAAVSGNDGEPEDLGLIDCDDNDALDEVSTPGETLFDGFDSDAATDSSADALTDTITPNGEQETFLEELSIGFEVSGPETVLPDSEVLITWVKADDLIVDGYTVLVRIADSNADGVIMETTETLAAEATSFVVPGDLLQTVGTTCNVTVKAMNGETVECEGSLRVVVSDVIEVLEMDMPLAGPINLAISQNSGNFFTTAGFGAESTLSAPVVSVPMLGQVFLTSTTSITAKWYAVSGAEYYVVSLRNLDTDTSMLSHVRSSDSLSHQLSGLASGTMYRFAVGAVPSGEESTSTRVGWTEVLFSIADSSHPPRVSGVGGGFSDNKVGVPVSFSVHADNASKIRIYVDDIGYEEYPLDQGSASFTRAFSQSGARAVQFRAYNDVYGWGDLSWVTMLTIGEIEQLAGPPIISPLENYSFSDTTTSTWINWGLVDNADHYIVSLRDLMTDTLLLNHATSDRDGSHFLSGLISGHQYRAAVGAVPAGEPTTSSLVGWSEVTFSIDVASQYPVIMYPTEGIILPYNVTNSYVEWTPVEGATGYRIAHYDLTTETMIEVYDNPSDVYSHILYGFTPGHSYQIKVMTLPIDTSTAGIVRISVASAPSQQLSKPVITAPIADQVLTSATTQTTLSWNAVTGADRYIVSFRDMTTGAGILTYAIPDGNLSHTLTGLVPGHQYRVAVGAVPAGENNTSALVGWAERLFSVTTSSGNPAVTRFTMSKTNALVGEGITFSVFAVNATMVRMIVDDIAYPADTYDVVSGVATFTRAFSQAGIRAVRFAASADGNTLGEPCGVQALSITERPVMPNRPVITLPYPHDALENTTNLRIHWTGSIGADRFVVALKDLTTGVQLLWHANATTSTYHDVSGLAKGHAYFFELGAVPANEDSGSAYVAWAEALTFYVLDDNPPTYPFMGYIQKERAPTYTKPHVSFAMSSAYYVDYQDAVTVHGEVNGFYKITFQLSAGGTVTRFVAVTDVGMTKFDPCAGGHSYGSTVHYEAAHPHKEFQRCTVCGWVKYTNTNKTALIQSECCICGNHVWDESLKCRNCPVEKYPDALAHEDSQEQIHEGDHNLIYYEYFDEHPHRKVMCSMCNYWEFFLDEQYGITKRCSICYPEYRDPLAIFYNLYGLWETDTKDYNASYSNALANMAAQAYGSPEFDTLAQLGIGYNLVFFSGNCVSKVGDIQTEADLNDLSKDYLKNHDNKVRGMVGYSKQSNTVTIAFQGSQGLQGWKQCFEAYVTKEGIHFGFDEACKEFENLFGDIILDTDQGARRLRDLVKDPTVNFSITGHSQGGALAQILHYYLVDHYRVSQDRIVTYTFASPSPFAENVLTEEEEAQYNCYNVYNPHDIVPRVGAMSALDEDFGEFVNLFANLNVVDRVDVAGDGKGVLDATYNELVEDLSAINAFIDYAYNSDGFDEASILLFGMNLTELPIFAKIVDLRDDIEIFLEIWRVMENGNPAQKTAASVFGVAESLDIIIKVMQVMGLADSTILTAQEALYENSDYGQLSLGKDFVINQTDSYTKAAIAEGASLLELIDVYHDVDRYIWAVEKGYIREVGTEDLRFPAELRKIAERRIQEIMNSLPNSNQESMLDIFNRK